MAIIVNMDIMMTKRKISLNELSETENISLANLSKLKTGKVKATRFRTLNVVCDALDCQPRDLLEHSKEEKS